MQCIGQLCYDFSLLDEYLAQPEVRKELGVGDREWAACNMDVNADMQGKLPSQAKGCSCSLPTCMPVCLQSMITIRRALFFTTRIIYQHACFSESLARTRCMPIYCKADWRRKYS